MTWRNLLITSGCVAVLIASIFGLRRLRVDSNAGESSPLSHLTSKSSAGTEEDPHARAEFETLRLRDPRTGRIPQNIRAKELAFAEGLPARAAKSASWIRRGPQNIGGRSRALALDVTDPTGNTILAAGVSGGIWRTTNGGQTWSPRLEPYQRPNVTTLAQDPRPGHTDTWFAGTGELRGNTASGSRAPFRGNGIYRSTDNGQTWELLPSTTSDVTSFDPPFNYVNRLAVDPSFSGSEIPNFSSHVITSTPDRPTSVYAADLDGDGDLDALSSSYLDGTIAWYENDGTDTFGTQRVLTTALDRPTSVHAADLDGDGDQDVLSASLYDDKISWFENFGGGTFSENQVITTAASGAQSVYAADLDGDGDLDVLSASSYNDMIAWYENDGNGSFSNRKIITTNASGARSTHAADLDGDGDLDVLSASYGDDTIAWYENSGGGDFSEPKIITTDAVEASAVYATDLNGDGDLDVLSASQADNKIAWYENEGDGSFGPQQVITTSANFARSVYAADLDGDNHLDVLSASRGDDKVAWYRNEGSGTFGEQRIITAAADGVQSVHAADLDGDSDVDVLSGAFWDHTISWHKNEGGTTSDESAVYAATYGRIMRSVDSGDSWSQVLPNQSNYSRYTEVAATSGGIVYATLSGDNEPQGIYRSTDGINWENITPTGWPSDVQRTVIAINPSNEKEVWFLARAPGAGPNGDGGQGSPINHILWKYAAPEDAGSGSWADYSDYLPQRGRGGGFQSQFNYDLTVDVHPDQGHIIYAGGVNLWRIDTTAAATDANSWIGGSKYSLNGDSHHVDQHIIEFSPSDATVMFTGSDGGVHRTDNNLEGDSGTAGDGAVTWTSLNNGYYTTQFYAVCQNTNEDDSTIMGGMQDNGTWFTQSASPADPWRREAGGDGGFCKITDAATREGTTRYTSYQRGPVLRFDYDDSGNQLDVTGVSPPDASIQLFINPFEIDPAAPNVMYYPGDNSLWRNPTIEEDPTNWTELSGARAPSSHYITALTTSAANDSHVLYYGTVDPSRQDPDPGQIYRLDNAHTSSVTAEPENVTDTEQFPAGGYISDIAVDPTDSNKALVVFSNYNVPSLFYTDDGGSSWTRVEGNLGGSTGPSLRSAAILPQAGLEQSTYFVGTSVGLYSTTQLSGDNTTWQQEGSSSIGKAVVGLVRARASDGQVLIGTHGKGVYSMDAPLPVELTSFDGTTDGDNVVLTWSTASEENNAGFEVQRRRKGSSFQQIGFVDGAGTTVQTQDYQFTDRTVPFESENLTYRLKQIDFDGVFEYGEPVNISLRTPDQFKLHSSFPNPARGRTTIRYDLPRPAVVHLSLYNALGQKVAALTEGSQSAGRKEIEINASRFSSGKYFYQLKVDDELVETESMTIVK